jgi:serine/threonine-protein phosphatase 5
LYQQQSASKRLLVCFLVLILVVFLSLQVMHGGLFSKDDVTLKDIRAIERVKQPPEDGLMSEILWSDPQPQNGRSESKRGVGKCPGKDESNGRSMLT